MDFRCFNLLSRLSNKDTLIMRRFIPVLIFLSVLALTAPSAALAAGSITVNTANDNTTAGDGLCTLREAINNANSDSDTTGGDCAAGSGVDTITFAADYTITLNGSQLPKITSEMTITGNGVDHTIVQASTCNPVTLPGGCTPATWRVFEIAGSGNLTVQNATVQNGSCSTACLTSIADGGGLYNAGALILDGAVVTSNDSYSFLLVSGTHGGGGVFSSGTLTIRNGSSISANHAESPSEGAGVLNTGTATIDAATINNNVAVYYGLSSYGGGVANTGTLAIQNGTVIGGAGAGNSAIAGAGIYNHAGGHLTVQDSTISANQASYGGGAGIYNYQATVTIDNGTITANTTSADGNGAGIANGGAMTIRNGSTISSNVITGTIKNMYNGLGGGIDNTGTLTVTGSRLLKNGAPAGGGIYNDTNASFSITGSCIVGNTDFAIHNANTSNQTATGNWWGDTAGPGPDGPSVSGDSVSPKVTFSGFLTSPILGCPTHPDPTTILVNSSADNTNAGDAHCTLREAIINANTNSDTTGGDCAAGTAADTIVFDAPSTDGVPITLAGSELPPITSSLTITGNGQTSTIIQANANPKVATYAVLEVAKSGTLNLSNMTVRNGGSAGIYSSHMVTVSHVTVTANNGVGISAYAGGIIVDASTISANKDLGVSSAESLIVRAGSLIGGVGQGNRGGGISNSGVALIDASTVSGNDSSIRYYSGGGISNSGTLTIQNGSVIGGSAPGAGNVGDGVGGIYNTYGGNVVIDNSTVIGNNGSAISSSGLNAIADKWAALTIQNGSLIGGEGGSSKSNSFLIYTQGNTIIDDSVVAGNSTALVYAAGGGQGDVVIRNGSLIGGEDAGNTGRGVVNQASLIIDDSTVSYNAGGGVYSNGTLKVQNGSIITHNSTTGNGAGIEDYGGPTTVDASTISYNQAPGATSDGGGIYSDYGALTVQNGSIISNNSAGRNGGGIASFNTFYTVNNSTISDNSAPHNGGGLYTEIGTITVDGATISHNTTAGNGGGIYATIATISNSVISGNTATGSNSLGGGCYLQAGTSVLSATRVIGNSAVWGGGIFGLNTSLGINNGSAIGETGAGNTASKSGGGVYVTKSVGVGSAKVSYNTAIWGGGIFGDVNSNIYINGSTVNNNTAVQGGGIFSFNGQAITIQSGSTVSNNAAVSHDPALNANGGGLFLQGPVVADINASVITNNTADSFADGTSAGGGGVYINDSTGKLTVENISLFSRNAVNGHDGTLGNGGAIQSFGVTDITDSILVENTASTSGGALWSSKQKGTIAGSCIVGNSSTALMVVSGSSKATANWWGDPAGPGPIGPSLLGDTISSHVDFSNFLTSPILGCATNPQPAVNLDKISLSFGDVALKVSSAPQVVTITNSGSGPLTISKAALSGSSSFVIATNTCAHGSIAPGASCGIALTFAPSATGVMTGTLAITSNAASSPDTVSLSGNGRTGTPALSAPKDSSASYSQLPKFSWKAAAGATGYHIQVDTAPTFDSNAGSPLFEADQPTTSTTWPGAPLALGTYYWRVRAVDPIGPMGYTLPYTFDVTLLKTPAKNGAVSLHLPKFTWQAVKGATGYHLQVFDTQPDCAAGAAVHFEKDTATTSYTMKSPDPALDMGSYYWRVTANGGAYTPCWRFDVTTLKAPKNGGSSLAAPKFSWAANKAATGYQITVTLVPDDGSGDIVKIDHKAVTTPSYAALPADGLSYGHYLWHIEEVLGVAGPPTPDFSFYITSMTKPVPGTFSLDTTPTFTWKAIKGETGYTLEIAQVADFSTILHSYDAGAKTTYTVPPADALGQGTYYWRVRTTGPGNFVMPGWTIIVGP